jgi:AmiR/NasT family two-component response regulator
MAETEGSELARLTAELADLKRRADAQEQKVRELEIALQSRVVIEQAVGMLAERFELSVADAFDLLRRAARDSRRQLRTLATEVTPGRATPPEVVAARGKA